MDKKIPGVIVGVAIIAIAAGIFLTLPTTEVTYTSKNQMKKLAL